MYFKSLLLAGVTIFFPACNSPNGSNDMPERAISEPVDVEDRTQNHTTKRENEDRDTNTIQIDNPSATQKRKEAYDQQKTIILKNHSEQAKELELKTFIDVHPSIAAKKFDALTIIAEGDAVCSTELIDERDLPVDPEYMNYTKPPTILLASKNSLYCDYLQDAVLCHFRDTSPIYYKNSQKILKFQAKDISHEPEIHFSDYDAICRRMYKIPIE